MELMDDMKISEMEEGKQYPASQGGHVYSTGVWFAKHGDEIETRHFWNKEILKYSSDGMYYLDEEDGVCYCKDEDDDMFDWYHKDVMQVLPDAIAYTFEEMTLAEFYDLVVLGVFHLRYDGYTYPKHLKGTVRYYTRTGELKDQN